MNCTDGIESTPKVLCKILECIAKSNWLTMDVILKMKMLNSDYHNGCNVILSRLFSIPVSSPFCELDSLDMHLLCSNSTMLSTKSSYHHALAKLNIPCEMLDPCLTHTTKDLTFALEVLCSCNNSSLFNLRLLATDSSKL